MIRLVLAGCAVAAATAASPALATATVAPEMIVNGNFSQTSATSSRQMSTDGALGQSTQFVTGWYNTPISCGSNCTPTTAGYNFIVLANQRTNQGTTPDGIASNDNGPLYLWGQGGQSGDGRHDDRGGSSNGTFALSNSIGGSGGNYIAADGAYEQSFIAQTIGGLTVGQTYQLTFNYAGAQQHGYDGNTAEAWGVAFTDGSNTQSFYTPVLQNASHGFTGWHEASMMFTATSTTEILGFVAVGAPSGQPPFSLLDDVSLRASSAPEPASWATMLAGFGLIGGAMRRRRSAFRIP